MGDTNGILILENTEGHSEHPISNHNGLFDYFECGDGGYSMNQPRFKLEDQKGGLVGKPFSKSIPYGIPISNVSRSN